MDELKNKHEAKLLKRAEAQKRPSDLPNDGAAGSDTLADRAAWERPERVEHTSEKEHPPGKE
jgi:hypothetical protein